MPGLRSLGFRNTHESCMLAQQAQHLVCMRPTPLIDEHSFGTVLDIAAWCLRVFLDCCTRRDGQERVPTRPQVLLTCAGLPQYRAEASKPLLW